MFFNLAVCFAALFCFADQSPIPSDSFEQVCAECQATPEQCFSYPIGCINDKSCKSIMAFKKSEIGAHFTLVGKVRDNQYVAMALSPTKKMEGTGFACVVSNGLPSLDIRKHSPGKSVHVEKELADGFNDISASFKDGTAQCQFSLQSTTKVDGTQIDLSQPWFLQLAAGSAKSAIDIGYHIYRNSDENARRLL